MASDPILLDLPALIETPRLRLRPPQAGDGPVWLEAVTESLPELRRFLALLPWVAAEPVLESSELHCRTAQAHFLLRKDLPFLVFDRADGRLVASVGLHRPVWSTPKFEVGYWGRSSCRGRGLVAEAVSALADYAFRHAGAQRLELVTDEDNGASRRVAERCGFVLEGVARQGQRAPDGTLRNLCLYARLPAADRRSAAP